MTRNTKGALAAPLAGLTAVERFTLREIEALESQVAVL